LADESIVKLNVCPYHSELASDVKDVKRALFGENEDGLIAMVQETKGAWHTVKWLLGAFGGSLLLGAVLLFIFYVEAPYKYAKSEDFNKIVTQQTLLSEKLGNVDEAIKDLTRELKRRP
jgi:hypothetical protein